MNDMSNFRKDRKTIAHEMLGHWAKGTLGGNRKSKDWLATKAQAEGVNTSGGFLTGGTVMDTVFTALENQNAYWANSTVVKFNGETIHWPRRTSGVTVNFVNEAGSVATSTLALDSVGGVAKKAAALVPISNELLEDSAADVGAVIAEDITQAFGKKINDCGFIADRTRSTYGGMIGLTQIIVDGSHNSAKIAAGTGHHDYTSIDSVDVANLVAGIQAAAMPNARFYISNFGFATALCRLAGASGGMLAGGPTGITYLGFPVVLTQSLSQSNASQTGAVMMLFGDLKKSSVMFVSRELRIERSDDRYFEFDQRAIRATMRWHSVNHDVGDSSTLSPIAGLIGTA